MKKRVSRRSFLNTTAAVGVTLPYINCSKISVSKPKIRTMGKLGFDVTTLGLGGQASIQWTPADVDPVKIILKAFHLGVNYFDTSNLYGPSQLNYGKAFGHLDLLPGQPGYNESLRRSIFLTSKTHLRWAKGGEKRAGVNNWSNERNNEHTLQDVRRTLSQIFGDGQGNYPQNAYLDMVLIHDVAGMEEVDVLYTGLDDPHPNSEHIGALAALLDVRDGANRTGLNPKEEKLIRHIGFSGHFSPPVLVEMIQRDTNNILDAMLIAVNTNDRLKYNMQYNVLPVAAAKDMGIISMKVFADGAMYAKEATWSHQPDHVVRTVGTSDLPSRPLVEYSLTLPGVHTAIIGIGQIDDNAQKCQLTQNISAAQVTPDALNENDRREIEKRTNTIKDGKTNYFQTEASGLTPPLRPAIRAENRDGKPTAVLTWNTAFSSDEPVTHYEIWRNDIKIAGVPHRPQTSREPFEYTDQPGNGTFEYKVVSIDRKQRNAETTLKFVS
ncbi:aldo/keto reductase [candidate division KSB1 bacterium]|nr:aldo/keto reductase [candidate division KSB1 bacterium]